MSATPGEGGGAASARVTPRSPSTTGGAGEAGDASTGTSSDNRWSIWRNSRIAVRLVVSTAVRARSAVVVSPAAIAIRGARLHRHGAEAVADEVVEVTGDPQPLLDRGPPPGLLDAGALGADQHTEQGDHGRDRSDRHEASRPRVHELGGGEDRDGRPGDGRALAGRATAVGAGRREGPDHHPRRPGRDDPFDERQPRVAGEDRRSHRSATAPAPDEGEPCADRQGG